MREHPIPPVTELLQFRAIGLVRGKYKPENIDRFSRGFILDEEGEEIEAVILGRALSLIKNKISTDVPHLWVVYPRSRDNNQLHLQIAGIWEPSTLEHKPDSRKIEETGQILKKDIDLVKEGDDYFSIRGELIFTKPETKELVIKIRQKAKGCGSKKFPFKIYLKGEIPLDWLRNFVSLDVRRFGQRLCVEDSQLIGPLHSTKPKFHRK